jgi:tetratricopeptide (TPR) repeat protein
MPWQNSIATVFEIIKNANCKMKNAAPLQFSMLRTLCSVLCQPCPDKKHPTSLPTCSPIMQFAICSLQSTILLISMTFAASVSAQDTVYLSKNGGGRTKISGRIADYGGQGLSLELPGGRTLTYPAAEVAEIETKYTPAQTAGDRALRQGRWRDALTQFQKAMDAEPRRWARRQLVARWVECYQALGEPDRAGEAFLLLLRDDPQTPYFDGIPLAWLPRQPDPRTEQLAGQWLARPEPAAALLGASYLLTTPQRAAALDRLKKLSTVADKRVTLLAAAQIWRTEIGRTDDAGLARWDRTIEKLPEPLRAGPYYVLGSARLQRRQYQQAALAFLRLPILHPHHRALAAQALLDAGQAAEHFDRPAAVRLYRELLHDYPDQSRPAAEAQQRLESMK